MLPTKISVKLLPIEYATLYTYLSRNFNQVESFGLNSRVNELLLHDLFFRRAHILNHHSHYNKGKARSITFKVTEARALYDELKPYSYTDVLIGQIFGHLDRSLINAGFNNSLNQ